MDGRMADTARAERALTIDEIAELTRAKPRAGDPLDRRISNIAPLDTAVGTDISFLDKSRFLEALALTRAGACFVSPRFEAQAPQGLAILVTPEPYRAFVAVTRALFPEALRPSSLFGVKGRSRDAHVHPSARLEANVTVDPLAVIGADAEIGAGHWAGRPHRPRLCDRRRRDHPARFDRRSRDHPSGGADRPGRLRLCAGPEGTSEDSADPPRHHPG
jgi:hypothetical protein